VSKRAEELLREAESTPVRGWDFSWLGERMTTTPLPWNFAETVGAHIGDSPDLLDMGTGGGEWLGSLPDRPPRTVATEAWPPNVPVARERLAPLGIEVVAVEPAPDNVEQRERETRGRLPFDDGSFSLVVNRHESFVAAEVARILRAGGVFLTEQVEGSDDRLYELLGLETPVRRRFTRDLAIEQLEATGIAVLGSEDGQETITFSDIGALAWYLKAVPWTVNGFGIETHREALRRLGAEAPISIQLPAFWLKAVRPEGGA
jgi:SAM-dependent methyltransferase